MSSESPVVQAGFVTKLLAIGSLATFWLLPFAPFVALAAVVRTRHLAGWPRKLSVTAAVLCSAYTLAVALLFYGVTIYILQGGLDRPPNAGWWRY